MLLFSSLLFSSAEAQSASVTIADGANVDRSDSVERDAFTEATRSLPRLEAAGAPSATDAGCTHPAVIPVVAFDDGWFTLPDRGSAGEVVEVAYRATFGPYRVTWSEVTEVPGSFRPTLPPEATALSPLQADWLTGLSVKVRAASGEAFDVQPAWFVVTDDGVEWLDRGRVDAEAPAGAWSSGARATVAEQEREHVWVMPPVDGGAP